MTGVLDDLDLAAARRIYMIANTPAFLLRHLQALDAVATLGRRAPATEIVESMNRSVAREDVTEDDLLRAYVALAALTFSTGDVSAVLRDARLDRIPWGREIATALRSRVPSTILTLEAPPQAARAGLLITEYSSAAPLSVQPTIANNVPPSTEPSSFIILRSGR